MKRLSWKASIRGFLLAACALAGWVVGVGDRADAGSATLVDGGGGLTLADGTRSMLYFPMLTPTPSARAVEAGAAVLRHLNGDPTGCPEAEAIYAEIVPRENFGGEYGSLRWVCAYLQAGEADRSELAATPEAQRFLTLAQGEGWRFLKEYLAFKYDLTREPPGPKARWFDTFVRTNGPDRARAEQADRIEAVVAARPGMAIADVGAASGFYTFRFAAAVGPTGKVHAVESDPLHGEYLRNVSHGEGLKNVVVQRYNESSLGLEPRSVDVVFMSNTYQGVYGSVRSAERQRWLESLRSALRPGGRLILVENAPDDELPGHPAPAGVGVHSGLVIGQLEASGLRLRSKHRFIPQQVVLEFDVAA